MSNIKLFESKQIRSAWNDSDQKWYFSIQDVVQLLTDASDVKDYIKKMKKRDIQLSSNWGTICPLVEMLAADGKKRKVQAANTQWLLRIIQSITSPKAEPFKLWLAQVGSERLEEIENPEIASQRIREIYKAKGYYEGYNSNTTTWVAFGCIGCKPTTANAGADINPACGVNTAALAGNTPTVGTGTWSVVSGTATITTPGSPASAVTGLAATGTATIRWTISNAPCISSIDDVVITTVSCCGSFVDARDGKTYNAVLIGTQCWMAQNLDYSTTGTFIAGSFEQSNNGSIEKYCYNDDVANCTAFGGLYQWAEMVQYTNGATNTASWSPIPSGNIQGVCPTGWHIPTDAEWCTMENAIEPGTDAGCSLTGFRGTATGGKLKQTGTTYWTAPNTGATNSSGFTALSIGDRYTGGTWGANGYGSWWSASENSAAYPWYRLVNYNSAQVGREANNLKIFGLAVRCIKD